jgi:DMSO/TMAO reductase YedYZ molybdopterin-dependent catalytic subunit
MTKPQNVTTTDSSAASEIRRLTRRGFATGGIAALAGAAGLWWLNHGQEEDGIPWFLRRALRFNETVGQTLFSSSRLAPTFDRSLAAEPRVNGKVGLKTKVDFARWKLDILSSGSNPVLERSLPLAAIYALPRYEMVTEFKCVEGWSQIVHWSGARLADFCDRFGHDAPYVALATPDREYYVGLEQASARHSQSLLAYEMNGQPLTPGHGAPLRLVCPLKYGVKSIKRIGSIQFTHQRPADYWAERGYDWYMGH